MLYTVTVVLTLVSFPAVMQLFASLAVSLCSVRIHQRIHSLLTTIHTTKPRHNFTFTKSWVFSNPVQTYLGAPPCANHHVFYSQVYQPSTLVVWKFDPTFSRPLLARHSSL